MGRALVVILHGEGASTPGLQYTAARLNGAGCVALIPEEHGFHDADAPQGHRFSAAIADLDRIVLDARTEPDLPVVLLGHGHGAAIALGYAVAHQDRLRGLILSAPLAQPPPGRLQGWLQRFGDAVLPDQPARPDLGTPDPDPVVDIHYMTNPLVRIGDIPMSTAQTRARRDAALIPDLDTLTLATLLLWGAREGLHPPGGAEHLLSALDHTDLTRRTFDLLYHDLLTGPGRGEVLDAIVAWLDELTR